MLLLILSVTSALASAGKDWTQLDELHHDRGGAGLDRLEVVCGRDRMTVHVHFARPFHGVVFSHGTPKHERCVHVGPGAAVTSVSFDIRYDRCGTVADVRGRFHENTIVVQSDEAILEAWDEAKRLRCEWLESFEKQSSRPTLAISDLDVVELNFQGDDIDCWMEVQEGKGPWARQVGGLVPVGSPLTLVIAINDHSREFDLRIKRCTASDGAGHEIELTDHEGCVLRPSLLTPFVKVRDFGAKATLVAYSHLFAFKFPDKMDVFVHCVVEVCRHGCQDSCTHQQQHHHGSYHHYQGLESKKIQKLAAFAAGQSSVREIHLTGHHKSAHPYPGREALTPAAQRQIQRVVAPGNSSAPDTSRATFKPPARKTEPAASASSHVHNVFVDVENGLRDEGPSEGRPREVHRIVGHDVHWISEGEPPKNHRVAPHRNLQPEPAPWSGDDVRPLPKHEVSRPKATPEPLYHLNAPFVTKMQWSSGDADADPQKSTPAVPQPEPAAAWTYEEVRPMHSPEVARLQLHTRAPPALEPQPEPGPWTFQDVRGLSKDNLRLLSLNHKMKSTTHAPVYREFFHPFSTSTLPQPVYVSRYTPGPFGNASSSGGPMKMMMMMMPTMLPVTYQTALWPHRTQSRFPRPPPARNHYPYPVPQFSPHGQLMMSVVGDRRIDEDDEDVSLHHKLDVEEKHLPRIRIGETAGSSETSRADVDSSFREGSSDLTHRKESDAARLSSQRSSTSPFEASGEADSEVDLASVDSEVDESLELHSDPSTTVRNDASSSGGEEQRQPSPSMAGVASSDPRPAVSAFVPPALDSGLGSDPEATRDRPVVPGPRSLDRRKRSSEPVFGVRQSFRAIAPSDLAFEWNLTRGAAPVYRGRPEEIVYGICMSPVGMGAGVGFVLILTLLFAMASVVFYEHACRLGHKTSQLRFLTRNFDGQFENLYRITRPYLYPDGKRNVGG